MAIEEEVSRLYGLPLEDFTRERNEAARAARKEGRREEAEAIGRLPKPSIAAWAVNQLARDQRRDVDLLLDSGKRLLDAQRSSLEGQGRAELDQARESLDKAIGSLISSAKVLLEGRAAASTLEQIHETLRAAAVSPEGREQLARGTLTKPLQGTGWEIVEGLAADLPPETAKPAPAASKPKKATKAQLQAARAAVREAKKRRDAADRAVRDAERRHAAATKALEATAAELEDARQELAEADDDVAAAEQELRDRSG